MGPVFALPLEMQEGTVVEDSELNAFFAQVIGPVIKANPRVRAAKVYLVKSRDFNAYSVAEPEIFIFSQVIERGNLPMVVGILLHELGHAAGHHSMRMEDALRTEKWRHALPALLGAATLNPLAMLGSVGWWMAGTVSKMMLHSREHEYAADAFSLRQLKKMGWPTQAIEETLKFLLTKEKGLSVPGYLKTHPYASERLKAIRSLSANTAKSFPPEMEDLFQRIKVKVIAYCAPLDSAENRVNSAQVDEVYKIYGHSICAYRKGLFDKALKLLSDFENKWGGDNVYVQELRCDILWGKGDAKGAVLSIDQSLKKRPSDILFSLKKAHILFVKGQYTDCKKLLMSFVKKGSHFPLFWNVLGRVLYKKRQWGESYVCQAEEILLLDPGDSNGRARRCIEKASLSLSKQKKDFFTLRFFEIKNNMDRMK